MSTLRAMARHAVANVEEIIAGSGLVIVVAITVFNVVNRYVFRQSGVWAPELAGVFFAWVVFLGAGAAAKRGMHISIDVLVRLLPPRVRKAVQLFIEMLLLLFLAYATWLAIKLTISSYSRETPVLRIPFSYVYGAAACGFALMVFRRAVIFVEASRGHAPEPVKAPGSE